MQGWQERRAHRLWGVTGTVALAGLLFIGLVLHRQLTAPTWIPRGADWDSWYLAASWFGAEGGLWPSSRWPAHGLLTATVDLLTPGLPLHVAATLTGMLCLAAAAAATFDLGRRLMGTVPGLVAASLLLTMPVAFELGSWTSAYTLWMTATIVAAAGLAAAAAGQRGGWWWAGIGTAVTWAVLAKALPGALGLTGLGLLVALLRRDGRGALCFVAPILLAAVLYALFPSPLMSFQDQVQLTLNAGAPAAGGLTVSGEGYVFGRRMGPIVDTLLSGGGRADARWNWNRFRQAFPSLWPWTARWLLLGLLAAGVGALRGPARAARLAGWTAVVGVALSVAPSPLALDPQIRFLAPLLPPVALLFVAPFAAAARCPLTGPLAAVPLLALLLAALPSSPLSATWLERGSAINEMATGGAEVETLVWYDLAVGWPDRPVIAVNHNHGGTFATDGRSGFRVGPGDPLPRAIEPQDLLLLPTRSQPAIGSPASELGPAPVDDPTWEQRIVAATWRTRSPGVLLVLLETVEQGG